MTPGRFPLAIYRGDSYVWRVQLWYDDHRSNPFPLDGYVANAEIRDAPGGAVVITMTCVIELPNIIDVELSAGASSKLPVTGGVWDLQLTDIHNFVSTWLRGDVTVIADVTDSLIEPVITPFRLTAFPKRGRAA